MFYYDTVEEEDFMYYNIEVILNEQSGEDSKNYYNNDYEEDDTEFFTGIIDINLKLSFLENTDFHFQTIQEFYKNYF